MNAIKVCLVLFFLLSATIVGCLEIESGTVASELLTRKDWGEPKAKESLNDYEFWWYGFYGVDTIVFLKNAKVVGKLKHPPDAKSWDLTKDLIHHAKNNIEYRTDLDRHIDDIINRRLQNGMTKTDVRLSWGRPSSIEKKYLVAGYLEEWTYEYQAIYQKAKLVFRNGLLQRWSNE